MKYFSLVLLLIPLSAASTIPKEENLKVFGDDPEFRCIGLSEPCSADYQCCPWGNHNSMCCQFSSTLLDYVCHLC